MRETKPELVQRVFTPIDWYLTGKYDREDGLTGESLASESPHFADNYLTESAFDTHDVLDAVADEVDATPAQTALAWQLHHDQIAAPIVGARTVPQLEENLGAATVELGDAQVDRLSEAHDGPYANL